MPQLPDAPVGPNIEIDIDQKHVVELIDMEEKPSQFRDKRKDAMTIIWKMNVWNMATGAAIIDDNDGLMWEHWGFTPDGTWRNTTTGTTAKAREWTEAFLGREITDDEMSELIRRGFKESLLNKKAVADFEWRTVNGTQRVSIIRLRPYKAPAQNGTAPNTQPPVATPAAETPEERRARLRRELEEMEGALPS